MHTEEHQLASTSLNSMASSDMTSAAAPSQEELEDIILSARYGEIEEIQDFVKRYGNDSIASARDERGNTCLHMAAANGHAGAFALTSLMLFELEKRALRH